MIKKQNIVPFEEACGSIRHNMTNDLCFHEVLISNQEALKGLIASLLHLDPEEITVRLTNQVLTGNTTDDKEYTLDITVDLNNDSSINLEMQVVNELDWPERSLLYLCRDYDKLQRGSKYKDVKNAYHIGFLDFTLFKNHPEFYGSYFMKNAKDGHVFSSKFSLSVIELNHIDMASEEDKQYHIDKWAELFKAKTWEEVKMITKDDKYLDSAARSVYMINQDNDMVNRMLKREDEIAYQKAREEELEQMRDELFLAKAELEKKDAIIKELQERLSAKS